MSMSLSEKRRYVADNLMRGIYFKVEQHPYSVLSTKIKNKGLMVFCNNKWYTVRNFEHLIDGRGEPIFVE